MNRTPFSQSSRAPKIRPLIVISLYSLLAVLTVIFIINDGSVDKTITSLFYNASFPAGERFPLGHVNPWMWMNESEIVFDLILLVGMLLLLIAGVVLIKKPSGKLLLRSALYMLIGVIIVLLIVNLLLKNYYGRPRPYQTNLWPDRTNPDLYNFYHVWKPLFLLEPELLGDTESFPSGHTTSMSLFSLYFFIFRDTTRWAAVLGKKEKGKRAILVFAGIMKYVGLVTATFGALLMGFSRIVAGMHFASDIIWAIGIVWTVTWLLYRYVFQLYRLK